MNTYILNSDIEDSDRDYENKNSVDQENEAWEDFEYLIQNSHDELEHLKTHLELCGETCLLDLADEIDMANFILTFKEKKNDGIVRQLPLKNNKQPQSIFKDLNIERNPTPIIYTRLIEAKRDNKTKRTRYDRIMRKQKRKNNI